VSRAIPAATVRPHAINDLSHSHDAAERLASFDIFAACVVDLKRCMNENGTAIARRPGPVLDVLSPAHDERRPGLADADDLLNLRGRVSLFERRRNALMRSE